jgi:hypothetical protein
MAGFAAISSRACGLILETRAEGWYMDENTLCHANRSGGCCELGLVCRAFHHSTDAVWLYFRDIRSDAHAFAFIVYCRHRGVRAGERTMAVVLRQFYSGHPLARYRICPFALAKGLRINKLCNLTYHEVAQSSSSHHEKPRV